jgi:hypothetical protein
MQKTTRAILRTGDNIDPHQCTENIQLYAPNGTVLAVVTKQAAQADSVASTVAGVVTDLNLLLAKLRLANIIG